MSCEKASAVLGQTGTKALTVAAAAVGAGLEARLAGTLVAARVVLSLIHI